VRGETTRLRRQQVVDETKTRVAARSANYDSLRTFRVERRREAMISQAVDRTADSTAHNNAASGATR